MTDITRADGAKVHFDYDAVTARRTAVTLPGGDGKISFTYDDASTKDLLGTAGPAATTFKRTYTDGLVTGLTWAGTVHGTVRKIYNGRFRLDSESVDGFTGTARYNYDADGLLTRAGGLLIKREATTGRVDSTTFGGIPDARTYDATYGEPLEQQRGWRGACALSHDSDQQQARAAASNQLRCSRCMQPGSQQQPHNPPPRAARLGAASGVEGPGRAQRQRREHDRPYSYAHRKEQHFESTGARKEPTREARYEYDEAHFRCR